MFSFIRKWRLTKSITYQMGSNVIWDVPFIEKSIWVCLTGLLNKYIMHSQKQHRLTVSNEKRTFITHKQANTVSLSLSGVERNATAGDSPHRTRGFRINGKSEGRKNLSIWWNMTRIWDSGSLNSTAQFWFLVVEKKAGIIQEI